MMMLLLPFILIWIGVVLNMPIYYYGLIGLATLFDLSMAFYEKGRAHGDDNGEARN